ncbi:MAG: apolipoprotein N-acyltransferase [Bacteroidales bacterium]|nr:apolipoprotein N-acyltransferase [Bacteroidales bacterium]
MRNKKIWMLVLSLLFAAFMSVPFLVPHAGFTALFGIVPLLFMDVIADSGKVRHFFWWYYLAFVMWNAATTFWVCNATIGGGIFAVLANAFQMALIFALYRLSKKKFNPLVSHIFLAVMWLAWERFYFSAEISWPWLTLGNSFARSIKMIQWYEFTGALGGSLWIWVCNLLLFYILLLALGNHFKEMKLAGRIALPLSYAVILAAPMLLSLHMYDSYREDQSQGIDVLIGQPNFDPYQKFQSMTQKQQNQVLLDLFAEELDAPGREIMPRLLLAPETFTSDIMMNSVQSSETFHTFQDFLQDYPGVNFLFGASTYEYLPGGNPSSYTARRTMDGLWYETHNTAFMTDHTGREEFCHKSCLVVGTEKMPYPRIFGPLDDKLGGVMGRCVGQDEPSVLYVHGFDSNGRLVSQLPIGCAICYESVYGEFCTGYVKKGARALTIITNDAWWGDTPGYKQHLSYASLRAIETRRDIARCGNTGISAFINQRGDVVSQSDWWERETLEGMVYLNNQKTFFVQNGDIAGRAATLLFLLLLLVLAVRFIIRK